MNRLEKTIRPLLLALALSLAASGAARAEAPVRVEVFKSPYCGCCEKWVEHMRKNGFEVISKDVQDVPAVRKGLGMPDRYGSCHTAKVGGYVIEGHVPAADVRRLLRERPKAVGLSAPGMPQGSPGMETATPQPYDTLLIHANGGHEVFAKH